MEQTISRPLIMTQEQDALEEVRKLSDFLDTRFKLPFGWRIGWDGILGFIPGVGDFGTSLLSLFIVYKAAVLGCPASVLVRMGLNILVDNVLDLIPVLGNFIDLAWKSNLKNVALIESYLRNPHRTVITSRWMVFAALLIVTLMVVSLAVLTFLLGYWLWGQFRSAW